MKPELVSRQIAAMTHCSGCDRKNAPVLVRVGEEPDYESNTAYLCRECVLAAAALLPGGNKP